LSFWSDLLGGALVPTGAGLLWRGARALWPGRAATGWPRVWGVVTASTVRETTGADGAEYMVDVQYRYEIAGVSYTGTAFRPGDSQPAESRRDAEYRAALYSVGRRTLVSYNPEEPWVAVLAGGSRPAA
jgi:hypothetical protein